MYYFVEYVVDHSEKASKIIWFLICKEIQLAYYVEYYEETKKLIVFNITQ